MEWFGISIWGVPDPIKDMMRPEYKEPEVQPDLNELVARGTDKSFAQLIAEVDVYIGPADGYSYKSYDRLMRCRQKGIMKPVGPEEMYRYEGTESMKQSYWRCDPELECETWYLARPRRQRINSDVTTFYSEALKIDKFFKL